jgi:hypothetical protein
MSGQAEILNELIGGFKNAGVRYMIGGSVASSAIGLPRATLDTDILIEIDEEQVRLLAKALGAAWYLDTEVAGKALENRRAFNVIHMLSGYKFDLFPAHRRFHHAELDRATIRHLRIEGDTVTCFVATAEDMVLAKLHWYREGGEASERQWGDIVGMLMVAKDFDLEYLGRWARDLEVQDLLKRAIDAASKN